jgi:uncharacterized membrane protein
VAVIFAVASMPVIAALVARLTDKRTALVATALAAASWITIYHGIYARMYSLFLFLSALSFLTLLRAVGTRDPRRWAAWIVATVLTLIFLFFIAYYGWKVFNQSFHRVSPTLRISSRWSKLAMGVGGALMTLMCLASLARDWIALKSGNEAHFDAQIAPTEPVAEL